MSDSSFANLLGGISGQLSQALAGGQAGSIADFMEGIGEDLGGRSGEGLYAELIYVISRNMTFSNLLGIFMGDANALRPLRQPLREFVRDKVLQGAPPTEVNIREAVERLLGELDENYFDAIVAQSNGQVEDDIDFKSTLQEFHRQNFRILFRLVLHDEESDDEYCRKLFELLKRFVQEIVVLCRHCLKDGIAGVERILQDRVRALSDVQNPMIQTWMASMATQQLHQLVPQITVTVPDIEKYIIRTPRPMETSPQPSEVSTEAMEVGSEPEETNIVENGMSDTPSTSSSSTQSTPSVVDKQTRDTDDKSDATWHRVVPEEWVPIITRDIQAQRRQPPQSPFSDAYLSGLPSKRRKMMVNERSHVPSGVGLSQVIPESVKQAVAESGAQPRSNLDDVMEELAADQGLHNAYEAQVIGDVRERLSNDRDYEPEKFPNSEEYFNSKPQK